MGTVYRAHDVRSNQTVALKLLRDDDTELARRLLVEARAQARIDHPHVCRVFEVGEAEGEPFICMQYIDGEPLDRAAADLPVPALLEVFRRIALALHETHGRGIVHRDLKPANVLVERGPDGALVPYLVDFGLARELLTARGHTATGEVLGTPAYMAPEQALGEWREIDQRCDIWGLGATLYALLAGHPPFVAGHPWRVLMMVANAEPPSLHSVRPDLPSALVTIVMKCLERDPARRYPSARAFADDLQRFLAFEPIVARPPSLAYRLGKRLRQRKLLPLLLMLLLLSLALLGGVPFFAGPLDETRDPDGKTRIAAEFGREATSIGMFLRNARQMPLHDVEQERAVIRTKVEQLEARVATADPDIEGPAHLALGTAYLEIGELERARQHLERAEAAGESSPQLHYALGLTLTQSYERMSDTVLFQSSDEATLRERRERLDAEYRDQGMAHLRAAASPGFYGAAYAEALLAYYEGRYGEALEQARAAFAEAPWFYEAKLLEGRVFHSLAGAQWDPSVPGWEERMADYIRSAADALDVAAQMGRSDVEVHRCACAVWTRAMFAANYQDQPTRPYFERGKHPARP
ncbi:MAG: serine/threonine-protein kinase [Nannocystaceae bacterium]